MLWRSSPPERGNHGGALTSHPPWSGGWCWGVLHLRLRPSTVHSHGQGSWVCGSGIRWSL